LPHEPEAAAAPHEGLRPVAKALESGGIQHSGSANPTGGLVRSPLYGILHLTSAPDAPAFVQAGDLVHQGQTLCIVEAMKIFHEVKAEISARVDAVLGQAGQEVEAGAPLFRLAATA
jgi:acetyl-CoA carboxylase biotin carboxyl carrier protein